MAQATATIASGNPMDATPNLMPASDSTRIHSVSRNAPARYPAPPIHAISPGAAALRRRRPQRKHDRDAQQPWQRETSEERESVHLHDPEERGARLDQQRLRRHRLAAFEAQLLLVRVELNAAPLVDDDEVTGPQRRSGRKAVFANGSKYTLCG